jgi:hypothetical protein
MHPRTSSLQQPPASAMNYFDFQPEDCSVSPVKKSNLRCLDAFHDRVYAPQFEAPANANIYARRALPPLPSPAAVPALRNCSSSESMASSGPVSRPSTAMSCRQDKSLPPLPFRLQRSPSFDSDKENTVVVQQVSRPRQHRGLSFRSLLNRHSEDEFPLASPKSGYSVTRDSRTDSVMGDYNLCQVKTNGTISATSSRRPSALSLTHLKAASKKINASAPPVPSRPSSRKGSTSTHNQHRWGTLFRTVEDDKEDVVPMPITPGMMMPDLSFNRCYYFYARNCNGYVLSGGSNGDACENCAHSGFLGSP